MEMLLAQIPEAPETGSFVLAACGELGGVNSLPTADVPLTKPH